MRVLSFDVGTRNFALCLIDTAPLSILQWEVIDTHAEFTMPAKPTIEDKKRALLACLCRRRATIVEPLRPGDRVVIEQQPFGKCGSPTMNVLAHTIGTFFLMQHADASPEFSVRQVAARTKLKVTPQEWGASGARAPQEDGGPPQDGAPPQGASAILEQMQQEDLETMRTEAKRRRKTTASRDRQAEYQRYKINKGRGVEFCTAIVSCRQEFEPWRGHLRSSKKKDDLADAMLQALSQVEPVQAIAK